MAETPRKPFEPLPELDASLAAAQRRLYETGASTFAAAARAFGRSLTWTRAFAKREGWKKPSARKARAAVDAPMDSGTLLMSLGASALRLMHTLERQLAANAASEQDARMMASLIKMLGDFRKNFETGGHDANGAMNADSAPEPAATPDDLARIRREVVERLFDPDWSGGKDEAGSEA